LKINNCQNKTKSEKIFKKMANVKSAQIQKKS